MRIRPGTYRFAAPASLDSSVVVIRGDDVTVDFGGARLVGTPEDANPDRAAGVAVRIEGGRNIVLRNAHIRGYKVAVLARGTKGLTLADNDLSYNWKPRLYSLVEHESLVDWLSFHHNEKNEWLRYGAAMYLEDVSGGEVRGNRAEQGMNGLMLVRSDHVRVWNNVLSFNSGLGVGLYRSSNNSILHNQIDFDVRGYSEGFYRRGQDSAGILVYEQSSQNVIAFNSATHGGDGFFLWAGQQTMDSGEGGANDNLVYRNDFNFAPANAIEATFSRNVFVNNGASWSEYGLWGGYSHDSRVVANTFVHDRIGIGIEHGQDWIIERNEFADDSTGVSVWADRIEPSDWGYPKHHDTRSRDYRIGGNSFAHERVAVRARDTRALAVRANTISAVDTPFVIADSAQAVIEQNSISARAVPFAVALPDSLARRLPHPLPGAMNVGSAAARLPRGAIVVDGWGPFDYRSPKLWPADSTHAVPLRLRTLGPRGRWRVVARPGVQRVSRLAGRIGDTIVVTPAPHSLGEWRLTLEYRGEATLSPRGRRRPAGAPYRFSFGRFEPPMRWDAKFFVWSDSTDPRTRPAAFAALLDRAPLLERSETRLDYEWYRPLIPQLPLEHWALDASTTVNLPPGRYELHTISDDAVRVWIDGTLAIDRWVPHESAVDSAAIAPGRHRVRVQYYQVDGWVELRTTVERSGQSSVDSRQ